MMPSLRLFGNVALPGYGTMLFISFVVGVILLDHRVRARALLPAELKLQLGGRAPTFSSRRLS